MFLDLVALEIPLGREPDWDAAHRHLKALSDDQCRYILSQTEAGRNKNDDDDDLNEDRYEDENPPLEPPRERIEGALLMAKHGWNDRHPTIRTLCFTAVKVLVGGGDTDGPDPPAKATLGVFCLSGAATAAGFIGALSAVEVEPDR